MLERNLNYANLQNSRSQFVEPTFDVFTSVLTNSDWQAQGTFDELLTDKLRAKAWPLTVGTFLIPPNSRK